MTAPAAPPRARLHPPRLHFVALAAVLACALALPGAGFAQTAKPAAAPASQPAPPKAASPAPARAASPSSAKPGWAELTPGQQQALKPLASSWASISEGQKRKWLEISKTYPSLPPEDQATMHSRMTEWVALSPHARAQARLNFAKTKELAKELTPEEKKAKWQAYQSLSPEEKQKLAAKASPKPAGAATATKPVAPQKLASVPSANKQGGKPAPKIKPSQQADGSTAPPPGAPAHSGASATPAQQP